MMQIIYEDNAAAWPGISMNHGYSTTEMCSPINKPEGCVVQSPMSDFNVLPAFHEKEGGVGGVLGVGRGSVEEWESQ